MGRRTTAAVLTAGLVGAALTAVTPAHAQNLPSGEAMERRLIAAAETVKAAAVADPGFAEVRIDTGRQEVVVYRVAGAEPAATGRYRSVSVPTGGLPVRIAPALLTRAQSGELNARLDADWRALWQEGIEVQHYGPGMEGGPFQIGVKDAEKHRASLVARYGIFGAGTVSVAEGRVDMASRQNDSPPYWGGALIKPAGLTNPNIEGCSSGFGAYSYGNGKRYLITAYHCVNPNDTRFWDGGNDLMGRATAWNKDLDAAFLNVSSAPVMFDGAWNDPGYNKPVTGARAPVGGESLCTSGAYSGVRCGGIVQYRTTTTGFHPFTGELYQIRGWLVHRPDNQNLAGKGDSGGPVFHAFTYDVEAKGIISNIWEPHAPCTGRIVPGRICSSWVFIADITEIMAARQLDVTR
ncbi:MAG TPA: hypothetical protein VF062_11310 [Candidatus Limnocylindrales bacterium]